jgi:hypothetical protein
MRHLISANVALISPKIGGGSIGIVRSWKEATELLFYSVLATRFGCDDLFELFHERPQMFVRQLQAVTFQKSTLFVDTWNPILAYLVAELDKLLVRMCYCREVDGMVASP